MYLRLMTNGGSGGGAGGRTLIIRMFNDEDHFSKFTSLITSGPAFGIDGGCKNRTIICL
jgi:hypothetical protein